MEGVTAVRDGDFVGVAAPTSFAAGQAVDALLKTAKWTTVEQPSSDNLYAHLRSKASSMFSAERDASKVAICALSHSLQERNYSFIDCQVASPHLASLGARSLPRREFLHELTAATTGPLAPDPAWRGLSIALPQPFMQNSRGPRGC